MQYKGRKKHVARDTRYPEVYLEFGSRGVWHMGGSPGDVGEVHVT